MRRVVVGIVLVAATGWACGNALDPSADVGGLRFEGRARVLLVASPNFPESLVLAEVSVKNVSSVPIRRTFDGGCFIRRFQAYLHENGERRLAWDSDADPDWACTDDLAILDLLPGEEAAPVNWRASIGVSEIRDSLPAGRYEIVIRIQAGDQILGAGFVDLD